MKFNHKRTVIFSVGLMAALQATAQDTYLNAGVITEGLNGTARYVGMGGAMDALGADLSVIGSNPAGIGLFRSSKANVSFGFVSQEKGKSFGGANQTTMSFDQAGFVYSMRTDKRSFINFAFNYNKSSNFDFILSAASTLDHASQNKHSYQKGANGLFSPDKSSDGSIVGYDGNSSYVSNRFNAVDFNYYNVLLTENNPQSGLNFGYYDGTGYTFDRAHTGYVGEYDFNISGNSGDRIYWGLTVGVHDVHYHAYSQYTENLVSLGTGGGDVPIGSVTMTDERRITGTGFDIKGGLIFRPIEESPFRIGLSVATPTWYDLTSSYNTTLMNNTTSTVGAYDRGNHSPAPYKFRLYTPWRFGVSAGTTVGDYLALGITYDYTDYASMDTRIKEDGYYYDDGTAYSNSSSDQLMNGATKRILKGVSTVKVGAEFRPDPSIAVRLGYNYVSPMYRDQAERPIAVNSISNAYTSTTDYTNWEATNRITAGLGYTIDKFSIDLAYQYSAQNGKFHPFVNTQYSYTAQETVDGQSVNKTVTEVNYADAVKVKNNRHQLILTLGYKF